jgi:hypothetical protein
MMVFSAQLTEGGKWKCLPAPFHSIYPFNWSSVSPSTPSPACKTGEIYRFLYSSNRPSLLLSGYHNPNSTDVFMPLLGFISPPPKANCCNLQLPSYFYQFVVKKSWLGPSSIVLTSLWLRRWWVYNTYRLVTVTGYFRSGCREPVREEG